MTSRCNSTVSGGDASYGIQAREYRPEIGRFLSQDRFQSAGADLHLQSDPLTQNRYAFAGGNPVSNVEWDGHRPTTSGSGSCPVGAPCDTASDQSEGGTPTNVAGAPGVSAGYSPTGSTSSGSSSGGATTGSSSAPDLSHTKLAPVTVHQPRTTPRACRPAGSPTRAKRLVETPVHYRTGERVAGALCVR